MDVISVECPTDASNTDGELILHMDQCYMASPPGIQVLFCLKLAFYDTTQSSYMMYLKYPFIDILLPLYPMFRFDECVEGGESILVDSYPVLEELRQKHPKQFEVLTRLPYTVHRVHDSLDNLYVHLRLYIIKIMLFIPSVVSLLLVLNIPVLI